jgi:formimidoylglutamate deiminase
MTRFRAAYVLGPEGVHADADLVVTQDRIVGIEAATGPADVDLGRVALVPGLVNAHSHAFQRLIRGRTEHLRADAPHEDFWSWRALMYESANRLSPAQVEAVSRFCFLEMALSGVTTVGEFHYLHRSEDDDELAHRVIGAARAVGLRITLLRVAYHRAGPGRGALPEQRRFVAPSVEDFLGRAQAVDRAWADDAAVTVGLAPHSVRAVPRSWLQAIAQAELGVVHIHACEQRAELAQCHAEHGMGPVQLLDACGLLRPTTTLVHATHLDADALDRLAAARPTVCACPSTERNLGDGFLPAEALLARGVPVALGTDSHADVDLWAEMRLVEYHERLRAERRNVLAAHAPIREGRRHTADVLWPMATEHGARALGLDAGALRPGALADFTAVDLDHPSLAGVDGERLVDHLAFAATPAAVRSVHVGGVPIVEGGRHARGREWTDAYLEAARAIHGVRGRASRR